MNKIRIVSLGMLLSAYLLSSNCFANASELKIYEEEKTISVESKDSYKNTINNEITIDNIRYKLKDINEQENKKILTKNREIEESKVINTNDKYLVLNQFEKEKNIDDDGYTGVLKLQNDSLDIKIRNSYMEEYKVYITKNYNNVKQNELNDIPKTIEQDGITYYLTNPLWEVSETERIDNSVIPISYNGIMNYEGIKQRRVITNYNATAIYRGTMEKEVIDNITIKIKYEEIPQEEEKEYNLLAVTTATTGLIICSGIIIYKRKNIKVYNFKDGKWQLVKKIRMSNKPNVIDITPNIFVTSKYKICLDYFLYRQLLNKEIQIKYFDKKFKYKIIDQKFEIFV